MNFKTVWKNNSIQFPRLLAEIRAIGLTPEQIQDLMSSMDLTKNQLAELFDRAEREFERIKTTCKSPCESMAFFEIRKKVRVTIGHIGEGYNGEYNPGDPSDRRLLRFNVEDLTSKKRDSQDASFCTEMTVSLPTNVLTSVCRYIAHAVVDKSSWKKSLEEISWFNDAISDVEARRIHHHLKRRKNGSS